MERPIALLFRERRRHHPPQVSVARLQEGELITMNRTRKVRDSTERDPTGRREVT